MVCVVCQIRIIVLIKGYSNEQKYERRDGKNGRSDLTKLMCRNEHQIVNLHMSDRHVHRFVAPVTDVLNKPPITEVSALQSGAGKACCWGQSHEKLDGCNKKYKVIKKSPRDIAYKMQDEPRKLKVV